jgi:hypothetical protein
MDVQEQRIGMCCAWGVALFSWIGFFVVLALMFRATGCNRGSEAGSKSALVVAGSVVFESRSKNRPLQPIGCVAEKDGLSQSNNNS